MSRHIPTANQMTHSAARAEIRRLAQLTNEERSADFKQTLRVAIAGNVNTDFLSPGLQAGLASHAIDTEISALPYDSWIPSALAGNVDAGAWIIWVSAMGGSRGQTERPAVDVAGIAAAVRALADRGCQVVVILPEALQAEDDPFSPFCRWRADLVTQLRDALEDTSILLSLDHLQRQIGPAWFASRYWTLAKCPCHPDSMTMVGQYAASVVAATYRQDIRAVICDLDDTLWGGIVGEVGPEGLNLDPDGEGRPFLALQRYLKDLSDVGIPLSVVSKNDPVHAKRPFVERKEMILSYDDFVYFNASWSDKHHAIDEIIRSLNLGRDQVCFLDDSSFERDQACNFLPGLVVPELDHDPEQRLETLVRSGIFARPMVRTEDRARVEMYKTERSRQEFAKHIPDADEYLRSLDIKLGAIPVTAKILPRVTQLVQKTNQFNITNKRMEADQILNLAKDKENFAYGYSVSDKFGDAGLVGVLVGTRNSDSLDIDVWVLSCRVFNRTIEQGMFAHLLDWSLGQGVRAIRAVYNPSPKNHLVAEFLPALGFAQTPDSGSSDLEFICDCDATQPKPHNVQILDPK